MRHFKGPHIEGRIITNPKQLRLGFLVFVEWEASEEFTKIDSKGNGVNSKGEFISSECWVTALLSDEVDFKAWQEEQLNG